MLDPQLLAFNMVDPLRHAKDELSAAKRAIDSMSKAKDTEIFEQAWREFLSCLEKAWIKTEQICHPHRAEFQPWQGKYQRLRKKDALLRYLKQARNADNHSIQDVSQLNPGKLIVKWKHPSGDSSKDIEIDESEANNYNADELFIELTSPHIEALPVKNQGKWFNPPKSHLGKAIEDIHPVTLAEHGFEFYSKFLAETERKFFAR